MKVNVKVNRTFRINGKEYGSIEEMPEEVRAAFQKAMSSRETAPGTAGNKQSPITFNGVEYASAEEMPTFARNLYEQALGAAETGAPEAGAGHGRDPGSRPIEPEPLFSARSVVAMTVLAALALLAYFLLR